MIWSILSWLSQHPAQVVGGLVFVSAFTYIISAAVYAVWLASETRKAQDEVAKFDRIMQANHPPSAAGFNRKRVGWCET